MKLEDYFSKTTGVGVMSTADGQGTVNSAIYATPHFLGDGLLSFIARDRLTRKNLNENPSAHYLFIERNGGFRGIRLSLEKVAEREDEELISKIARRAVEPSESDKPKRFLITFKVKKILNLLGPQEVEFTH